MYIKSCILEKISDVQFSRTTLNREAESVC